jgi:AcrR family transcriptional regulator
MDTREKIMDVAMDLFNELGFHKVATSRITREAGLSAGILFYHFATKEDLIIELYIDNKVQYLTEVLGAIPFDASTEQSIKMLWEKRIEICTKRAKLFKYCTNFENSEFYEKAQQDWRIRDHLKQEMDIFEKGIKEGELKPLPVKYMRDLYRNKENNIIRYLFNNQDKLEDKAFFETAWQEVWDGFKK